MQDEGLDIEIIHIVVAWTNDGRDVLAKVLFSQAGVNIVMTEQFPVESYSLPITPYDTEFYNGFHAKEG
jgi:hypothetical protein